MNSLAGKVLGRYYLLEQIGLGGMATVYKGLDLDTDQKVALKILAPTMARTPQFKARFEREIKLLRTLKHPSIVPILSFGEEDEHSYIVMPFYPNGTLQDRLSKGGIGPREGARLMNQISAALDFAHRQGIVHRDVKPSNILLDEEGNAMLSDFGFAQVQDASLSLTGSALIGTPAYMSPEQCKGDPVDARSDQYSLAVILHQMTTGKLPFDADTPMGLVVKHVNVPLTPPRQISPNLPEGVEAVLVKAMAKDPAHRFSSVAEMNRVFQRSLAEAFDSQGRLRAPSTAPRPTPLPTQPPTQPLAGPVYLTPPQGPSPRPWYRRRGLVLASLLVLFACPTAALAFGNGTLAAWLNGGVGLATQDLVGTIHALSTQISGDQALPEDLVATAVFQTMVAADAFGGGGGPEVTMDLGSPEASPTPTSPPAGGGGWPAATTRTSPPPTYSGSGPTWTPSRTPTRTPTPTLTASPTDKETDTPGPSPTEMPTDLPTDTPAPTPTNTLPPPPTATRTPPPPTPTRTPAPIPPNQCKSDPGHPHYCTPTPS
jgi:tRNA A-37 threonylcarbamoyl transferase component Bud32